MTIQIHSSANGALTKYDKDLLYEIMREAYASTEIEIWGENYVRMDREEYFNLIYRGEILYATMDGEICGSVYFYPLNKRVFGFSLLSSREGYKNKGVGSALIRAVEEEAKKSGADTIHIEILRPRDFETPNKSTLRNWYEGMGYKYNSSEDFAQARPDKARLLKVPSHFDKYTKSI